MKKIAVIGVGSAGILSLCHFLQYMEEYKIVSVYDPDIPIVGIGESTGPFFWNTMYSVLNVTETELFETGELDATIKYGTLFKNWREDEDFLHPLFGDENALSIHFNTYKLKSFTFDIIKKRYENRFEEIQGKVTHIENNSDDIKVFINDIPHTFDYVIDCRGFPKDNFEKYNMLEMPINHCLVHNIEGSYSYDDWGYTLTQATKDGWMFGVPLRTRKSYGYLFNNTITTREEARQNFANLLGLDINDLSNIEYKFRPYYIRKLIDGRLMYSGNSAVFLEPMIANSLFLYNECNRFIYDYIVHGYDSDLINYNFYKRVSGIHDIICYYYQGGSIYDTPFWRNAIDYSTKTVENSLLFRMIDEQIKFRNKTGVQIETNPSPFSIKTLLKMDKFFGYNRWTK